MRAKHQPVDRFGKSEIVVVLAGGVPREHPPAALVGEGARHLGLECERADGIGRLADVEQGDAGLNAALAHATEAGGGACQHLSLIHISEPTRLLSTSYA